MTSSTTPWIASGMAALNQSLTNMVETDLDHIIADRTTHARFLNMLSMLEHMGSRKIMLSQHYKTLNQDTLKHLAEESRHAFFFKRQAEKIAGHDIPDYRPENTLRFFAAQSYFGRLDAAITRMVGDDAAYPWVSLIIELRACWFYGLYQSALERAKIAISLRGLMAEEDQHLAEMYEACGTDHDVLQKLSAHETGLFQRLWQGISSDLPQAAAA